MAEQHGMMSGTRGRLGWFVLAGLLVAGAGCRSSSQGTAQGREGSMREDQNHSRLTPLVAGAHSKIVALGRVRLEVPETAVVTFNKTDLTDVSVRWQALAMPGGFKGAIAARTEELRQPEDDAGPPLIKIFDLSAQRRTGFLRREVPGQTLQTFELWQDFGDHAFVASVPMLPQELVQAQRVVTSVTDAFMQVTGNVVVSPSGFGVDGGIERRPFSINETLDADVHLPLRVEMASRDIATLNIATDVFNEDAKPTLLARIAEDGGLLQQLLAVSHGASYRYIRKGKRIVCGLAGEEIIARIAAPAERPGITGHAEFDFGGEARNPLRPSLQITFDIRNLATEADFQQFVEVWDHILQSLQLYE